MQNVKLYKFFLGKCDTDVGPPSWLKTAGHGLNDWGTGGINLGGNNFCLVGNKTAEIIEVAYHINLTTKVSFFQKHISVAEVVEVASGNITNACINQDPRIHYCVPFCQNDKLQLAMIEAALKSYGQPIVAAIQTQGIFNDVQNWAFTVINVNLNAEPEAHLVVGTFLDPAWCTVYIGMQTTGDPYLYEMQAGIVLQ